MTGQPSASASPSFSDRSSQYRERVDAELDRWLSTDACGSTRLLEAVRYALLNGGKRIRPLLAYACGEFLHLEPAQIDPIAAAIEMIHTYSLVHDDLPAMDDDELRRGRPTVHVAYDEATAILVGDALHALAFQILTEHHALDDLPAVSRMLVRRLAAAAGLSGMVCGQDLDLAYSGKSVSRESLEEMFDLKTGRLIGAAITMPLEYRPELDSDTRDTVYRLTRSLGLCFQIRDDVLDVTASTEQLGKPSGSDERNDRTSYPARFGLDAAEARVDALRAEAMSCFDVLGKDAEGLRWLTEVIATRNQ